MKNNKKGELSNIECNNLSIAGTISGGGLGSLAFKDSLSYDDLADKKSLYIRIIGILYHKTNSLEYKIYVLSFSTQSYTPTIYNSSAIEDLFPLDTTAPIISVIEDSASSADYVYHNNFVMFDVSRAGYVAMSPVGGSSLFCSLDQLSLDFYCEKKIF